MKVQITIITAILTIADKPVLEDEITLVGFVTNQIAIRS